MKGTITLPILQMRKWKHKELASHHRSERSEGELNPRQRCPESACLTTRPDTGLPRGKGRNKHICGAARVRLGGGCVPTRSWSPQHAGSLASLELNSHVSLPHLQVGARSSPFLNLPSHWDGGTREAERMSQDTSPPALEAKPFMHSRSQLRLIVPSISLFAHTGTTELVHIFIGKQRAGWLQQRRVLYVGKGPSLGTLEAKGSASKSLCDLGQVSKSPWDGAWGL